MNYENNSGDFCFDCQKNENGEIINGMIVVSYLEMRDFRNEKGGEMVPCQRKKALCYLKINCLRADYLLEQEIAYLELISKHMRRFPPVFGR